MLNCIFRPHTLENYNDNLMTSRVGRFSFFLYHGLRPPKTAVYGFTREDLGDAKLMMSSGWYCTLGALLRQCRASQNEWGAMELHQTFCHCSGLNWKYFFIVFFPRAGYNFLTNATLFRFLTSLDLFKRSLFVVIASSAAILLITRS